MPSWRCLILRAPHAWISTVTQHSVARPRYSWLGSRARNLIRTRCRHLPQLLGVAAGGDRIWFPGTPALGDPEHCYIITVFAKLGSVSQNLGLPQRSGLIHGRGSSLRGWSYLCRPFLWDHPSLTRAFPGPAVLVGSNARGRYQREIQEVWEVVRQNSDPSERRRR